MKLLLYTLQIYHLAFPIDNSLHTTVNHSMHTFSNFHLTSSYHQCDLESVIDEFCVINPGIGSKIELEEFGNSSSNVLDEKRSACMFKALRVVLIF